ncbi:sensory rhodopsin transducer [Paradesertivirga mongoliensis]
MYSGEQYRRPDMTSHETACILNAGDNDAVIEIM